MSETIHWLITENLWPTIGALLILWGGIVGAACLQIGYRQGARREGCRAKIAERFGHE